MDAVAISTVQRPSVIEGAGEGGGGVTQGGTLKGAEQGVFMRLIGYVAVIYRGRP